MKVYFLKQAALNKINSNIDENIEKYSQKEPWLKDYFEKLEFENYTFDTGIVVKDFDLIKGDSSTDAKNAEILYEAFKDKLSLTQASDLRLWSELAHNELWEYMTIRWKVKNSDPEDEEVKTPKGRIASRYFFGASQGKAFVRQGIARLYWTAALTYDANNDDPYEYTKYIFGRQDILLNATERLLGRNKTILLSSLKVLKKYENSKGALSRADIRSFFSNINNAGGIEVLDALTETEAISLCQRVLDEILNRPVIAEGATVILQDNRGSKFSCKVVSGKLTKAGKKIFKTKPVNVIGIRIGNTIVVDNSNSRVIDIK